MASDIMLDGLKSWNINHSTALVPFSILLYDYCLTFVAEVERCWGVRLNLGLTLFYLNRYLVLFGHVPVMVQQFWTTSDPKQLEICHHLQVFHQCLAMVIQAVVGCIVIMRMYALYERSRKVLALYITFAIALTAATLCVILTRNKDNPGDLQMQLGCGMVASRKNPIRLTVAWTGLLLFDSLVFGMTLYKSIVLLRLNRVDILDIFLRDGTIYFGVMLLCYLGNILTLLLGGPSRRNAAAMTTNVISSVMISRLVLNLRDPSLVLNRRRASFITSPAELTYPITTIAEVEHPIQLSDRTSYPGLAPFQPQVGRSRSHTIYN